MNSFCVHTVGENTKHGPKDSYTGRFLKEKLD